MSEMPLGNGRHGYRSDIDGLRAIAVLAVVLFHARLPGFAGGFVGVDVFFVISGFLITSVIGREVDTSVFSLRRFYERRVRRIFPALFVVLGVAFVAAYRLHLPDQFSSFASSVIAATVFASNILFWRQAGYFDANAAEKPLLHTWSLAVEEQFYIFVPLLLMLLARSPRRWRVPVIGALMGASFGLSVFGVRRMPSAAFYLAPFRAWELLLGALLALDVIVPFRSRILREAFTMSGVLLIGLGIALLGPPATFPGVNALLPTLGAALVIQGGRGGESLVSRLLGSSPLVGLGLISYSLYLWHWPMLVFAQALEPDELTMTARGTIALLSCGVAYLSWRFVERPFRTGEWLLSGRRLILMSGVAISVMAGLAIVSVRAHGLPGRLPASVLRTAAYANMSTFARSACFSWPGHPQAPETACTFGNAVPPTVALWGDSHAGAVAEANGRLAAEVGTAIRVFAKARCPPLLGITITDAAYDDCAEHNHRILNYLAQHREIGTVVLIARFAAYVEGPPHGLGPLDAYEQNLTLSVGRGRQSLSDRRLIFRRALARTVEHLQSAGRRVAIVYPIPEVGYNTPVTLARLQLLGRSPWNFSRPLVLYMERQAAILSALDALPEGPLLIRIHPERLLCNSESCLVSADGQPLYTDGDHLSAPGAAMVSPAFQALYQR